MPRKVLLQSDTLAPEARERLERLRNQDLLTEEEYRAAISAARGHGSPPEGIYRCSFCAKAKEQVRFLFTAPGRVYICNECITVLQDMMAGSEADDDADEGLWLADPVICEFCEADVARADCAGFICSSCLETIEERRETMIEEAFDMPEMPPLDIMIADVAPQEMTPMDLLELHNRALDQMQGLVDVVGSDQMTLPTPCEEWDVRQLLNHVVGANRLYASVARRHPNRRGLGEDVIGDDPAQAYRESAEDLKQAWSDPQLLDEVLTTHLWTMPGRTFMSIHLIEIVVHGWDLSRAIGEQAPFDAEVIRGAMESAQEVMKTVQRGQYFGQPVEVGEDATEIDRLAAFLGRRM